VTTEPYPAQRWGRVPLCDLASLECRRWF